MVDRFVQRLLPTKHKHKRRTTMISRDLEPAIPAIKRLKTYALDRKATGTGNKNFVVLKEITQRLKSKEVFISS
jgi:hypothetical protein